MVVWISNSALTQGLFSIEANIDGDTAVTYIDGYANFYHGEGKSWHRTRQEAVQRAEELRMQKIIALKKQVAKLESLNFND